MKNKRRNKLIRQQLWELVISGVDTMPVDDLNIKVFVNGREESATMSIDYENHSNKFGLNSFTSENDYGYAFHYAPEPIIDFSNAKPYSTMKTVDEDDQLISEQRESGRGIDTMAT